MLGKITTHTLVRTTLVTALCLAPVSAFAFFDWFHSDDDHTTTTALGGPAMIAAAGVYAPPATVYSPIPFYAPAVYSSLPPAQPYMVIPTAAMVTAPIHVVR